MNQIKNWAKDLLKRGVQELIRKEEAGWPPITPFSAYQPPRPEKHGKDGMGAAPERKNK